MMLSLLLASALTGGSGHAPALRWERNFEDALKKARAARKPLMLDFWADWCEWCHRLDETTYVEPAVVRLLEEWVTVKIDTEGGRRETAVASRYDVDSLPTIAFVSPSGRLLMRVTGFQGPGKFPRTIESAKELAARVMDWEAALERDAADAAALAALGGHLFEQEAYEEAHSLLSRATVSDAERPAPERKKTRLILAVMNNHTHHYERAEALVKEGLALRPAGPHDAKLLFVLGRAYLAQGREGEARAALKEILTSWSESPVAQKARETLVALDGNR